MARNTGTALTFVRRIYVPRVIGLALGFPAVAVVLYQQQASWYFWLYGGLHAFIWPHLAYWWALRSEDHADAEYRNLMLDSALAGFWVGLLSLNLLPVALLFSTVALANMSVGGWRLFGRGIAIYLTSGVVSVVWVALASSGFVAHWSPTLLGVLGAMPLMIAFPVSIGLINFRLSRRLFKQRATLEKISRTDELSQLNNRRYWEDAVGREFERHRRSGAPLSLIMLDIDHFKQVNDNYGHLAGDQMIRELGALLQAHARQSDVVGRYGGEEFGVLLPDTGKTGARVFAERIRLAMQSLNVKPYGVRCTVSLGVAEAETPLAKYRHLIENADKALYDAKRCGRNLTSVFDSAPAVTVGG